VAAPDYCLQPHPHALPAPVGEDAGVAQLVDLYDDHRDRQGDADVPARLIHADEAASAQVQSALVGVDFVDGSTGDEESGGEQDEGRQRDDGQLVEAVEEPPAV